MKPTDARATDPLANLLLRDRRRLETLLTRLEQRRARGQPHAREQAQFTTELERARERHARRVASVPAIRYPEQLPVSQRIDEISALIAAHQVVVVCGETGSGKTTQLPKACLALGRGIAGLIGHTQPRRIAARSVATRLAEELDCQPGAQVGFKVRFTESGSADSLIRVMTDGILLAEAREDPDLTRYDTLIIDEAHERSLNIDFLLGYLKRLLPRRPDLKVIVTSATIDPQRFAAFFGDAPIIEVSGRTYPVEVRYRPLGRDDDDDLDPGLIPGVLAAVDELESQPVHERGDILVFLPGEREIRDVAESLEAAHGRRLDVLPLYSRLSWADQQRVFGRGSRRRVVLATNVAETSITVPGIRAVIDSGLARIARYSPRSKILRLPIEPVSQASANQRAGRCGRVGPGICIRLYDEADFTARPAFTPPEILRSNLASVILQMAALGLGSIEDFPFLDPPDSRAVNDGYRLLQEIEAVDDDRMITDLGRQLARIPVDPRIGRMLFEAQRRGALAEVLVLAAALSIQDPRERPGDAQAEADAAHAQFADPASDFAALLNLWRAWREVRSTQSVGQARRWCRDRFLSAARMREWEDLTLELEDTIEAYDWRPNAQPAAAEAIHRSLLPGLLGGIGEKTERGDYLGPRGLRFQIAPGTPLKSRGPKWVMAASLTETQRVYARTVAAVDPLWIESAAHHLVKRSHGEPEWSEARGIVTALETVTLYGLTLSAGRRVNYGSIAPEEARRLFAAEALVHRRSRLRAPFLEHNARLRAQLEDEEARGRRRGVLVDEDRLLAFYLQRLPPEIHDLAGFERWRRAAERDRPDVLRMSRADVVPADAPPIDRLAYPDTLRLADHELKVHYRFEPGADDDGASVHVPLPLLARLTRTVVDWGIPGYRHERLTEAIRGLPKALRRQLVPAPDVAARCLTALLPDAGKGFWESAAAEFTRLAGAPVAAADLRGVPLADYLSLRIVVVDLEGRELAAGRDVESLQQSLRTERGRVLAASASDYVRDAVRDWDWGVLPEQVQVERAGLRLTLHPAVADRGNSAALVLEDTPGEAARLSRDGIRRLLVIRLEPVLKPLRKALAADVELPLLHQPLGPVRGLIEQVCDRVVARLALPDDAPLPRDRAAFEACAEQARPEVYSTGVALLGQLKRALAERRLAVQQIDALPDGTDGALRDDLRAQLEGLFARDFVGRTPDPWLDSLGRYARAVARRAKRLGESRLPAPAQFELKQWRDRVAGLAPRVAGDAPERERLRWLVEEYGVSLFAQDLRTSVPVSPKRLTVQLELATAEARR